MGVSVKKSPEAIYRIVEKLQTIVEKSSRDKLFRSYAADPAFRRAIRIHRHLKALEKEILTESTTGRLSLSKDRSSDQIVIKICQDNIRYQRVAYLSPKEFTLLKKNTEVSARLRKCKAAQRVA